MCCAKTRVAGWMLVVCCAAGPLAGRGAENHAWRIGHYVGAPTSRARACEGALLKAGDAFVPATAIQSVRVADVNALWRKGSLVGWLCRTWEPRTYVQASGLTREGAAFQNEIGPETNPPGRPGFAASPNPAPEFSSIFEYTGVLPAEVHAVKCFSYSRLYAGSALLPATVRRTGARRHFPK
jgi:hypothetical protein